MNTQPDGNYDCLAGAAQSPKKISPVFGALESTDSNIGRLHAGIESLERALAAVLSPPSPESEKAGGTGSASELHFRIASIDSAITDACRRLVQIESRLTL